MHFPTSISVVSSLLALTGALPTLNQRSIDFCPGQLYYNNGGCSSGFLGCVDYEKGDETCGGPKRFFNDCFAGSGLGSFYVCANGFRGCSTNPRVCDTKASGSIDKSSSSAPSTAQTPVPGTCQSWEGTFYNCANGFKGCSTNPRICDPATKPDVPTPPTGSSECPSGSSFYVCASNGFRGCSSNSKICDTPTIRTDPSKPSDPITPPPKTPTCPKDTWYVRPNDCSSGFVGCTSSELAKGKDICGGEKRFWGSCPPNHGNYYNCANGFLGCTTDVKVCDKKGL